MSIQKTTVLFATVGILAVLGGCASEPESHLLTAPPPAPTPAGQMMVVTQPQQAVVTQPQQVMVTQQTMPGTVNSYLVVQAPPAPQVAEAVPARPSAQHVWIAGYWTWRNNRYEWMAAHWEVPPYSTAVWIAPRSESEGGATRFYEGRWN